MTQSYDLILISVIGDWCLFGAWDLVIGIYFHRSDSQRCEIPCPAFDGFFQSYRRLF